MIGSVGDGRSIGAEEEGLQTCLTRAEVVSPGAVMD